MNIFPIKILNSKIFIFAVIGVLLFEISFLYFGNGLGFPKLFFITMVSILILILLANPFFSMLVCLFVLFSGITQGIEIPYSFFAIVAITGLSWLINQAIQLKFSIRLDSQMLWICGILLSIVLSGFAASDMVVTLTSFLNFVKLATLYFLITQIIQTKSQLKIVFGVIICAVLLSLSIGIISELTDLPVIGRVEQGFRLRGLTAQPNVLALHLLIILPILMLHTFKKKNLFGKIVFAVLSIFAFAGFLGTFSRSALIAIFAIFIGLLYVLRDNKWLLFAAFFSVLALILLVPEIVWERIQSIGDINQDASLRWRFLIYQGAFDLSLKNPLIGIGFGNFVLISPRFVNWHLSVHNTFLEILTEAGIIGLSAFSIFILTTLYRLNYARKVFVKTKELSLNIYCTGTLIAFSGIFVFSLFHSTHFYFVLWALIGISTSFYVCAKQPINIQSL